MGQDRLEPLIAQITEKSMAVLVKGNYCDVGLWSAQAASNYLRLNSGGSKFLPQPECNVKTISRSAMHRPVFFH